MDFSDRKDVTRRPGTRSVCGSGKDTPMRFMTEDTPAVFSRNDSLSSLEYEVEDGRRDEVQLGAGARQSKLSSACVSSPGSFQSHLPRPSAVGRSGSSGSSTGASENIVAKNNNVSSDMASGAVA